MSANHIAHAALTRFNLQPAFAVPFALTSITAAFQELARANVDQERANSEHARNELMSVYGFDREPDGNRKPFAFAGGVAIIPVQGTLLNRFGYSWGYVTGYNFIRQQMNAANADPDVKGIIFDINTYGGEAAGCFELSRDIAALDKPTVGVVDSNAFSAGYAILSACSKAVLTPSGGVGSIGVICMHVSMERYLEDAGIEVTLIFSGDHKADGNPYEKLPAEVKADIQASVAKRREEFATLVAENRGMDVQAVKDTEAKTYRGDEALALGLIDAVATPAQAVAAFLNELSGSNNPEEKSMSTQANATPGTASAESTNTPVNVDQATADARKGERARMAGIMNCEEAKGKTALANHLALNTEMSIDEAKGILAASAPEKSEQAATPAPVAETPKTNALATAMANTPNPNVGADTVDETAQDKANANPLLGDYNVLVLGKKAS